MRKLKNWFAHTSYKLIVRNVIVILFITFLLFYVILYQSIFKKERKKIGTYDTMQHTSANARLVWPEDFPDGDRIQHQLVYVPEGYKYDATPFKRILIHTGLGEEWERFKFDQGEFVDCPVNRCLLTFNQSLGPEVDAVLFRRNYIRPTFQRPPNQIWIYLQSESPYSAFRVLDPDAFNWTATYRWDSDIPFVYGYFLKNGSSVPGEITNYAATKTKKVAWFVSNCSPNNFRTVYARELAEYIEVDVYGLCGKGNFICDMTNKTVCYKMLEKDYKFYLAFENANCRYYITEKLFVNSLSHNVIPIVMGPSRKDYELVAPEHSFIHVNDFKTVKELATYLHKLDQNDELYEEYFRWKNTGTILENTRFYCRLCAMLHDPNPPRKHYEDINKWWFGEEACMRIRRRYGLIVRNGG